MPVLSMFYGVIIRMYKEENSKHKKPYIHAEYQGQELIVSLDGEVLEGEMQKKHKLMVLAWTAIHEDELVANWNLINDTGEYLKIEPLK